MDHVIDYLYQQDHRLVVPIYACEKELDFTCTSHLAFAKSFGFSSYMEGRTEKIQPAGFRTVEDVTGYPWAENLTTEFLDTAVNNFQITRKSYRGTLGGGCFGPLTVTANILGIENCNRMALRSPEILQAVLDRVTELMITFAQKEEELGAEYFWIAEPLASLFSPDLFTPLCGRYIKQVFDSVNVPGFLHVCGQTTWHTQEMLKTGAEVFSIDWMTDIEKCLAMVPEDVVIMGNVPPMIFLEEDEATITEAILKLLKQTKDYKNFILSSGCQIPGKAPADKVQLLFDVTKDFPVRTNEDYRQIRELSKTATDMTADQFSSYCLQNSIPDDIMQAAERMAQAEKEALL